MNIENGETVLFIGDSITDCSRSRPIGKGTGLGAGYVSLVDSMLATEYPEINIQVLNLGINGNRITDLGSRWQRDVLDLQPNWLVVLIGINDVWRQFDRPLDPNQVTVELFESTYRKLLTDIKPSLSGLVLLSPYFVETNLENPMRIKMDGYGSVVGKIAAEFGANFVDLQSSFDCYLSYRSIDSISDDQVHLNRIGHTKIASDVFQTLTHV